jgi:hypothetical protein
MMKFHENQQNDSEVERGHAHTDRMVTSLANVLSSWKESRLKKKCK